MQLKELKNNLDHHVQNQSLRLSEEILPGSAIYRELRRVFESDLVVANPDISIYKDLILISGIFQNDSDQKFPLQIHLWEANNDIHG